MNYITTATLPTALQDRYEIAKPIPGGPVVSLIHYGQSRVNFSTLTPAIADALIAAGFTAIRKIAVPPADVADTPVEITEPPAPELEDTPDADIPDDATDPETDEAATPRRHRTRRA